MRLKPIVSYKQILVAILILAGLTACGREKQEPGLTNASNPPEKQTRLADKVRGALKDNIFLKPQELELVVIDEKDGFVKLSLTAGNRELRQLIADGADLDSAATEMTVETTAARQSLTALKKAVGYVKILDGVKAVLVTAEINTAQDQVDDMTRRKAQLEGFLRNGESADINNAFELLQIYNALHEQGPMDQLLGDILCSNLPPEIHLQLAQMLIQMRRFDMVEPVFIKYLEAKPDDLRIHVELAAVRTELKKFDSAIATLKSAVEKGGEPIRAVLRKDPRFQPLYNDVRFQKITTPVVT